MGPATAVADDLDAYRTEIEQWHRQRVERLTAEDGWLTLIGLFWLEEGVNTVGSHPGSDVVLPATKAPLRVGTLTLEGDRIHLQVAEDVMITHDGAPVSALDLAVDASGKPTILDLGDLRFFVIERSARYGLRVRDRQHPARFDFSDIEIFPIEERWRVTGRLETYDPPRTLAIVNVLGDVNERESPGTVVFDIGGRTCRLDAQQGPNGSLFLIFSDQTSGRETYGGGRYLYSEPVSDDGTVVLDFNKAYNPPCAVTDFATCPLPPRQNKLPVRIDAGEKDYRRHH
jgi:uncharacterized protein (DUF1684 family)